MSQSTTPVAAAQQEFWRLFNLHWENGTGRTSAKSAYPGWTAREFMDALAMNRSAVSSDILRMWRANTRFPNKNSIEGLLAVFFPISESGQRIEASRQNFLAMRTAWEQARQARAMYRTSQRNTATAPHRNDEWIADGTFGTEGLAELAFHPLVPTESENCFRLFASPIFGVWELDDAEIGLTEIFLRVHSTSHQAAHATMFGERIASPYVQRVAGGLKLLGPVDHFGRLTGNPLIGNLANGHIAQQEPLAIMEPCGDGADSITISMHAGRRHMHIRLLTDPPNAEGLGEDPALQAQRLQILDGFMNDNRTRDTQGRLILASTTRVRRGVT